MARSIFDILRLNQNNDADWEIIKTEYRAVDIDKVIIDGDTFTNYGSFQFVWEKSYIKEPSRSGKGTIGNLNSYATFLTPHLIMNFSIMSIDDYRAIMRKDFEKNEFVVECYDPIYNKKVKQKMYFTTPEMAKLFTINKSRFNGNAWEDFIELAGVHDYTVEMVGTNNDLDLVSVIYHLNPPSNTGLNDETIGENDVYKGEEIIIGGASDFQNETFGGLYKFTKWNLLPSGGETGNYIDGYAYTINQDLVLYAQWEATTSSTLNYNYGVADAMISENNEYVTSKTVVKDQSIGELPVVDDPIVIIDKTAYSPYRYGKWYKTPIKTENSVPIENNTLYWSDRDSTIYLIYEKRSYLLKLYIDGVLNGSEMVEYNSSLTLPQFVKEGYTFDGWSKSDGTKVSSGTKMPPHELILYGKWIKN